MWLSGLKDGLYLLCLLHTSTNGLISRLEQEEDKDAKKEKKAMGSTLILPVLHQSDQKGRFPVLRVLGSRWVMSLPWSPPRMQQSKYHLGAAQENKGKALGYFPHCL